MITINGVGVSTTGAVYTYYHTDVVMSYYGIGHTGTATCGY